MPGPGPAPIIFVGANLLVAMENVGAVAGDGRGPRGYYMFPSLLAQAWLEPLPRARASRRARLSFPHPPFPVIEYLRGSGDRPRPAWDLGPIGQAALVAGLSGICPLPDFFQALCLGGVYFPTFRRLGGTLSSPAVRAYRPHARVP